MENEEKFYIDQPTLVSFFIGDLKTFIEGYQGYFRFLKRNVRQNHKFLIMADINYFPIIEDYVSWCIDLPDFFKDLKLTPTKYEAVRLGETYTDPLLYNDLIKFISQYYDRNKAIELWSPRGESTVLKMQNQLYCNENIVPNQYNKPTITVVYDVERVSKKIWDELSEELSEEFNVVIFENITDVNDFIKTAKGSILTVSTDNPYSTLLSVIRANGCIFGLNGDHMLEIHKKIKTPLGYSTIRSFNELDSVGMAESVRSCVKKFVDTGKVKL